VETSGHNGGIGVTMVVRDKKILMASLSEGSPADKAGLQGGDEIIAVEGEPIAGSSLSEAVRRIRGVPGTPVRVTIMREGWPDPREFVLDRAIVKIRSVKARVLDGRVGYLRLTGFHERTVSEVDRAMARLIDAGVRGISLDRRNNTGGSILQSARVAERFLPNRSMVVFTHSRRRYQTMHFRTHVNGVWLNKPLVVLVNRNSASASEIVVGALKDLDRALIIGDRTSGKALAQSIIPLGEGAGVRSKTAKFYTPLGSEIHGKGIRADVEVKDPDDSGKAGSGSRSEPEVDLALEIAHETLKKTRDSEVEVLRYNASQVKARLMGARKNISQAQGISSAR